MAARTAFLFVIGLLPFSLSVPAASATLACSAYRAAESVPAVDSAAAWRCLRASGAAAQELRGFREAMFAQAGPAMAGREGPWNARRGPIRASSGPGALLLVPARERELRATSAPRPDPTARSSGTGPRSAKRVPAHPSGRSSRPTRASSYVDGTLALTVVRLPGHCCCCCYLSNCFPRR